MYGAVLGDIIGSPYEFGGIKSTEFPLIGDINAYTDDSVMTIAVAAGVLKNIDGTDEEIRNGIIVSMKLFGRNHRDAGYGGMFRRWLERDDSTPYYSYGNGAAMRVSSIPWIFSEDFEKALHVSRLSAKVTHNPEGIKAAEAETAAIWLANAGCEKHIIREFIEKHYYRLDKTCDQIRPTYRFDVSSQGTMPAAFAAFFEGRSFEEAVRLGISLGGDSDTIGAITGAIAEAYYGIPHYLKCLCLRKVSREMAEVIEKFQSFIKDRDMCF